MKIYLTGAAALLLTSSLASAGGIQRSDQSLSILFQPGNYAELSYGFIKPSIEGEDEPQYGPGGVTVYPGGVDTGNVADSFSVWGLSYKQQFNENWSGAIIWDQPYGADIFWPNPATDGEGTPLLGGTLADVTSNHLSGIVRYTMPENGFSAYGGLTIARANAEVALTGLAYGGFNGYNVRLENNDALGWLAGVSWERPDIAARVSLTYRSKITHDFDTYETLNGVSMGPSSTTSVNTPQSVVLDAQTGVAPGTLIFGSIRWVDWSEFLVEPEQFYAATGGSLVELEDTTTLTVGVGREFNETWSGVASFVYEAPGDDLVSPLAPTNGRKGINLAAIYNYNNMSITAGVNYSWLGDSYPETGTPDVARAKMVNPSVWGVGVRVGYQF